MTFGLGKTIEKVDRSVVAREEEERETGSDCLVDAGCFSRGLETFST